MRRQESDKGDVESAESDLCTTNTKKYIHMYMHMYKFLLQKNATTHAQELNFLYPSCTCMYIARRIHVHVYMYVYYVRVIN